MATVPKPRVFIDSDVLFAGAASPSQHGASLVVLRMAEITLIDAVASEQMIVEVERNLAGFLPAVLPTFRQLVSRCLRIVADPTLDELEVCRGLGDPKDSCRHAAAASEGCPWPVTYYVRHCQAGHPAVTAARRREFFQHVRALLVFRFPGATPRALSREQ